MTDLERSPLAPGEGTWAVFAMKVVRERDEARAEVERLRADVERLRWANEMEAAVQLAKLRADAERDAARAELRYLRIVLSAIAHPSHDEGGSVLPEAGCSWSCALCNKPTDIARRALRGDAR